MYIIPVFIPHAGCPHACTFCNQRVISGRTEYDMESVRKQIAEFVEHLPTTATKQLAFYGGSFTALDINWQKTLLEYANSLFVKHNIEGIRVSTRPDCINAEIVEMLVAHHVRTVELGVQSLSEEVLALSNRGHGAAVVAPTVRMLKAAGIQVGIQLMVGMQGQTLSDVQDTAEQVVQMQPDMVRIYSLMVLKDTTLEQRFLRGEFVPLDLDTTVQWAYHIWQAMQKAGIEVIRMGLQDEADFKNMIVAGAYHSAFGELVVQYHYRLELVRMIAAVSVDKILVSYPQRLASKIIGANKSNKKYLAEHFADKRIFWRTDNSLDGLSVQSYT